MGIDAALADELQFRQPVEEFPGYLRALPEQHHRIEIAKPFGKSRDILDVVVEDGNVVPCKLRETGQVPQGVEIVVQDRQLHAHTLKSAGQISRNISQKAHGTCRGHPGRAVENRYRLIDFPSGALSYPCRHLT